MRVGIDGRSLRRGPAGVATYVRNLLENLQELERLDKSYPINNLLWNHIWIPLSQLRKRWDLFHCPSYTASLFNFCPVVLTVHDVAYLRNTDWYPHPVGRLRLAYYRQSILVSDRIIVPSRFTLSEVSSILPQVEPKLRLVHLGVNEAFKVDPELGAETRQVLHLPEEFILTVGDIHARRNATILQEAAEEVGVPVVFVGKKLEDLQILEGNLHFSGISFRRLLGIYNASSVFVYPSVYEGFGLPLLEAMACGVPVVAANRGSIPEVCGDVALLVEPEKNALAQGIREAMSNKTPLVGAGLEWVKEFSWKRTAEATRAVYKELVSR